MFGRSLWQDDFPRPADLVPALLPSSADVAVIGAGFTGLHAATALAASSVEVVVLERHEVGEGASSRNGGFLTVGPAADIQSLAATRGLAAAQRIWRTTLAAIEDVERQAARGPGRCDFVRCGGLDLARSDDGAARLAERGEWASRNLGHSSQLLTGDKLAAEIGCEGFAAGLLETTSATIHPTKYLYTLAADAMRQGVRLIEHASVLGITPCGQDFIVRTELGDLCCQHVVVATNAYHDRMTPNPLAELRAVDSYLVATAPLSPATRHRLAQRPRAVNLDGGKSGYFRFTPDRRLLFGYRHDGSSEFSPEHSARRMRLLIAETFPSLNNVSFDYGWSGRLAVSGDELPRIGRREGALFAAGYSGKGIALSAHAGQTLAAVVITGRADTPFADRLLTNAGLT